MSEMNPLVRIRSGTPIRIDSVSADDVSLMEVKIERMSYPANRYEGSYEFTPTDEEQTIPIAGQIAEQNIRVNPIPQNYGRIEWNGSTLRVI